MKFYQIIKASALGLALIALAGCEDAEYQPITNRLYISEAAPAQTFNHQVSNLTVTGATTTSIHVRLAQAIDQDTHVTLELAPEVVEEYNKTNGSNYLVLPSEYLSFAKEVEIKAGVLSSDPIAIDIAEFPTDNGEAYCIPIKIASSDAPVATAKTTSRILFLLSTPLRQLVPTMDYSIVPSAVDATWNIQTEAWTLEAWVWMSSFNINNQAIFNATASREIYIRFGDADVDYDKLQIKTAGSQFNSNLKFATKTWYHVAFVTGNGRCTMYINGQEDSYVDLSATDYTINGLALCSSGSIYFRADAQMAQVRFWKKALATNVLQDNMNRAVPANSDGLFGYWKLDEGDGQYFYDSTDNHFDLRCQTPPIWSTEEVDFSDPNK